RAYMHGTLTVRGEDERPALVVMLDEVIERALHIFVRELQRGFAAARAVHERVDRGLPIARRVDAAAAVEYRRLAAQDERVGELIGRGVVERLVPARRAKERGRVHEE